GQGLGFHYEHRQKIADAPCTFLDIEPAFERRVLRRDADRTTPGMTMMAGAWLGAERLIILDMDPAVTAERDQCSGADRHCIGAHRECLGDIGAAADTARNDQLHLAVLTQFLERLDRLAQGGQGRDAGMLDKNLLSGAGAALHAIEHDDVGPGLDGELHVEARPCRADLDKDRLFPIGELAQFLDLDRQIVGTGPIRVTAGAALVNPGRQGAHLGDPLGNLLPEQHAAASRLRALANDDLDRLAGAQMARVEAIARRQYLVDEDFRLAALFLAHAAITGRRAGPNRAGAAAERPLGIGAERAKAHSGDRDRDLQFDRLCRETGAERQVGGAALAIAFERVARDRGAEQYEVVETRQRAQSAEAADLVEPFIGRALDLSDDLGRKGGGAP